MEVVTMSDYVDGNAVIGAFSLALGTDLAQGSLECAGCGRHPRRSPRRGVYRRCPGLVLRCPGCDGVEVVIVEIAHRLRVTIVGCLRAAHRSPRLGRPARDRG